MERDVLRRTTAACEDLLRDELLTTDQVAEFLKVARRQVQRLGIPWIDLGRKTPRYQVKDVLGLARDSPAGRPATGLITSVPALGPSAPLS